MANSSRDATSSPDAAKARAPTGTGHLEADPDLSPDHSGGDADSSLGVRGALSDTTSVASSIYKFREENGRTYHAYKASEAAYFLPNDELENERLDLQHNLYVRMQDNRLYSSPAGRDKPLGRVLDCGTGTGIWAIDFADEHPESAVVGVDLSPIQSSFVPPGVEFFIDDLESEWTFVNKFDFIYCRMMSGSIRDWPKFMGQAFSNLNPGGFLEMSDLISPMRTDDGTLKEDSVILKWNLLLVEASEKLGATLNSGLRYKQQMIDAGFEDVTQIEYKWPLNSWPRNPKYKELGQWNYVNLLQGLQALSLMLFTKVLGWSVAEVEALLVDVRKEAKNREIHGYWPIYVVYGRKPE